MSIKANNIEQARTNTPAWRTIRTIFAAVLLAIGTVALSTGCANPLDPIHISDPTFVGNQDVDSNFQSALDKYQAWKDAGSLEGSALLTEAQTAIDIAYTKSAAWNNSDTIYPDGRTKSEVYANIRLMRGLIYYGLTPQYINHDGENGNPDDWDSMRPDYNDEWSTAISSFNAYLSATYVQEQTTALAKERATAYLLIGYSYLNSSPSNTGAVQNALDALDPLVASWSTSTDPELKALYDGVQELQQLLDGATPADFDQAGNWLGDAFPRVTMEIEQQPWIY